MTFYRPFLCSSAFAVAILVVSTACASKDQSELNIPEGEAAYTLKEFANQAEVEIMFNPQIVYGVRTNAVNGKYYPHLALRIMLSETSLTVNYDKETGAYGIMRNDL